MKMNPDIKSRQLRKQYDAVKIKNSNYLQNNL